MDSLAHNGYSNNHSAGVSETIDRYTPYGIDLWQWSEVSEAVTRLVSASAPRSVHEARVRLGAVARLTIWSHFTQGDELDPAYILDAATIERYVSTSMPGVSPASQRRAAQRLHAVAAAVMKSPRRPSPRKGSAAKSAPYSSKEIVSFVAWAESQTTERLRANADVVLALTFGAGLYPAEVIQTRVGNIVEAEGVVIVNVTGRHARQVPVRRFWSASLLSRVQGLPSDALVLDSAKQAHSTTSMMRVFGRPSATERPDPQRMRSTWIVGLLDDRVPLPALLRAAGFEHSNSLHRYLPSLRAHTDLHALLAGSADTP